MDAKKSLTKGSNEEISSLFKMMLLLVEDMKQDHDFHYQKLTIIFLKNIIQSSMPQTILQKIKLLGFAKEF
jgi:hypothetical protein